MSDNPERVLHLSQYVFPEKEVKHLNKFKEEAFASFDIEADGDNPVLYSMRSIGIALFSEIKVRGQIVGKVHIDSFYINILPRQGASVQQECYDNFWSHHPEQWAYIQIDAKPPRLAMTMLARFLSKYSHYHIKWIAKPANVDWMFLKTYYEQFKPPNSPSIGFHCHCLDAMLRTYKIIKRMNRQAYKDFLHSLADGKPYTHNALDDALHQGSVYMNFRSLLDRESLVPQFDI